VLTDRSKLTQGQNFGVYSQNIWRLADMGAKHAFLRAGFGFGHMPKFMVEDDIASGRLRAVRIEMPGVTNLLMPMHAVYRKDAPPGPAGRWLIQSLKQRAGTENSKKSEEATRRGKARRQKNGRARA
jgi:DNA-binding transcriptional LysR family regulator